MTDPKRILIVDDSAAIRAYYSRAIQSDDFQVDEAENGVEGLEKALAQSYVLLIVDVNMPKMDGYEFVRRVRTGDQQADVPIVMITSEREVKDREAAFRVGANLYLPKPVKDRELSEAVRLLVGEQL